jgi:hypothetical protein
MGITRIFLEGEQPENLIKYLLASYLEIFFCMAPELYVSIFIHKFHQKQLLILMFWYTSYFIQF